jgi:putative exosortase-associated protein (TIGR04073 family)
LLIEEVPPMQSQYSRALSVVASGLMIVVAIGMMFWPLISRADTPLEKAGRGLAALTTPFLEIPGNIVDTSERKGPLAGWTEGLAKGLGMAIVRPAVGAYELASAPFPAPKNFEPVLEPEYPWSYFGPGDHSPDVAAPRRR